MGHQSDRSTLHVLAAADRNVLWGCAVAVRSLVENAGAGKISITVLGDGLTRSDQDRLKQSWTTGSTLNQVSVSFIPAALEKVTHLLRSKSINHMAYQRLFVGDVLPESADRCVYLDCDVLFLRNARELLQLDLEGNVLGAVAQSQSDAVAHFGRLGVAGSTYFNSGVLLVDLAKWRALGVGEKALAFATEAGSRLTLYDQDAINAVLVDQILPVSDEWNTWARDLGSFDEASSKVIHFTMSPKPWHADYEGVGQDEFFQVLDRTEFAGERPFSGFGLGRAAAAARRRLPYWPTVLRMLRERLTVGRG